MKNIKFRALLLTQLFLLTSLVHGSWFNDQAKKTIFTVNDRQASDFFTRLWNMTSSSSKKMAVVTVAVGTLALGANWLYHKYVNAKSQPIDSNVGTPPRRQGPAEQSGLDLARRAEGRDSQNQNLVLSGAAAGSTALDNWEIRRSRWINARARFGQFFISPDQASFGLADECFYIANNERAVIRYQTGGHLFELVNIGEQDFKIIDKSQNNRIVCEFKCLHKARIFYKNNMFIVLLSNQNGFLSSIKIFDAFHDVPADVQTVTTGDNLEEMSRLLLIGVQKLQLDQQGYLRLILNTGRVFTLLKF